MSRTHETQEPTEKLFLVYVNSDDSEDDLVEGELRGLVEAAGAEVAGEIRQRLALSLIHI